MSEVMAIESIVEAYAKFKGYFCEMRVPFKLKRGYSDFDIVGFNPKTRATLVVECKAWGSSDYYPSCDGSDYKRWFKKQFRKIIKNCKMSGTYLSYLNFLITISWVMSTDNADGECDLSKDSCCHE